MQGRALGLTEGPLQQDLYHSLADADASQQATHYIGIVFFHSLQAFRAQLQAQITIWAQLQTCDLVILSKRCRTVQAGFLMQEQAQKLLADMALLYHRACNKMSPLLFPRTSQGFGRSVQASGDAVGLCCSGGGPCHCYRAPSRSITSLHYSRLHKPQMLKDKDTEPHAEWYRARRRRRRMVTWVQAEHSRVYQSCRCDSSCPGGPTYRLVASAKEKPVLMVQWYTPPCTSVMHISQAYQSCTSVTHISHAHQSGISVVHISRAHQSCSSVTHISHAHHSSTSSYFMHSIVTGIDT